MKLIESISLALIAGLSHAFFMGYDLQYLCIKSFAAPEMEIIVSMSAGQQSLIGEFAEKAFK